MEADRSKAAQARIEAALERIEAAARAPRGAASSDDLAQLQARHGRLKAAVQESLDQLDQLIEGAQG